MNTNELPVVDAMEETAKEPKIVELTAIELDWIGGGTATIGSNY